MHYKKWTAECRFDSGLVKKIEILTHKCEVRLFVGREEIPRLKTGTPKSRFIEGATGLVTDEDNVFDLGGAYVSVKSCSRYRPSVLAIDGLARFVLGRPEIVTIVIAAGLFGAAILLATLL